MYIQVVFEIPTEQAFDYIVPNNLRERIVIGGRVLAPFGQRRLTGYVVQVLKKSAIKKVKSILDVIDDEPVFSNELLKLAEWISSYYCCPLGQVFKTMLPASVKKGIQEKKTWYVGLSEGRGQPAGGGQAASDGKKEDLLSPSERAGRGQIDDERINLENLKKRAPARYRVLMHLYSRKNKGEDLVALSEVIEQAQCTKPVIDALVKEGLIHLSSERAWRRPHVYKEERTGKEFTLTEEQVIAKDKIFEKIRSHQFSVCVVHGVTGSGKTELYLQVIEETLKHGRSVIFLVPEISLTAQTVSRVVDRFSDKVAIIHSRLSHGERYDEWSRIFKKEAVIVVGARSAVFAPVSNLGLIIVDEEHERSYKQEESPRYSARDIAVMRAKLSRAGVILGSATPSLETYNNIKKGKYDLVELTKRVENQPLPIVKIIDMRLEAQRKKGKVFFSDFLLRSISERLTRKEQIILFLNRRGFSPFIICQGCGTVLTCSECSISLVFHKAQQRLRCHHCGFSGDIPTVCPTCNHTLKYQGMGTEKVETYIKKLFPEAKVQRMDLDTTQFKNAHNKILQRFSEGNIDILIGTQMIAKGLDFPRVTLVGVIFADIALNLPDFRSSEYSFQLLSQVAGRAGRGPLGGEVIIQTYTPNHYAIKLASLHDYKRFFAREMKFRSYLDYPPLIHFINIIIKAKKEHLAHQAARYMTTILKKKKECTVIGPNPAVLSRLKGVYRWQIIVGCSNIYRIHEAFNKILPEVEKKWRKSVIVTIDIDPINLF